MLDQSQEKEFDVLCGDSETVLKTLPSDSVDMCVTSPPYYALRNYHSGEEEIGQEETPIDYVNRLVAVFREVKRVLKPTGTLWLNLGDTYNGTKKGNTEIYKNPALSAASDGLHKKEWKGLPPKSLIGIPWRVAFALQDDGWILRSDICWYKVNCMPNSCPDRCTSSHEYIFMLAKEPHYYFDYEAIEEVATGYDGRKDTLCKGGPKYAQGDYLLDGTTSEFASAAHERWKFKKMPRFGGNKYGGSDEVDGTYSGREWEPKYKNLMAEEKGQTNHSFHLRREEGLPDEVYPVRRKRDVWTIPTHGYPDAHFATFPEKLVEPCILAGCPRHGLVMDCFNGAGTTGVVAVRHHRRYVGIELNPKYVEMSIKRIAKENEQMTFDF